MNEAETRAEHIDPASACNSTERVFVDFVLSQYVTVGVEELDHAKITPLFI
jgi:hypothetical protein